MAHAVPEESVLHMGLPLPNGKLAMWMFLVTEIMFFTALIGTYIDLAATARRPRPSRGPSQSKSTSSNGSGRSIRLCSFAVA